MGAPDTIMGGLFWREAEILWKDQHTFIPDFVLRHEDGRQVFIEIAGFWTPEYIKQKRVNLDQFRNELIVLGCRKTSKISIATWGASSLLQRAPFDRSGAGSARAFLIACGRDKPVPHPFLPAVPRFLQESVSKRVKRPRFEGFFERGLRLILGQWI